ncbi:MAG: gfo/Idh/MocA family oxidoreductase [Calditrichaeota bacterium]|nr:MAG: gfo/Idh/MocA family oxidoreductase [Calditrichota bacterium]
MRKIKWGILGTARIATEKVIPAMRKGKYCEIHAIASREDKKAQSVAQKLAIPRAYGSYQALLADPEIEAVYNPLPNHLHVPLSVQAIHAGKHVLCEKPIAVSAAEAQTLNAVAMRHPHLKVMEAFMYRFHPQWQSAKKLVQDGEIGRLRFIQTLFSYYNDDPLNVRNQADLGGGGLMDIGCYGISLARYLFNDEPLKVSGSLVMHPQYQTDCFASAWMEFRDGTSAFTVSTLMERYQRVFIFGTLAAVEIEIPFNAPPDRPTRIFIKKGDAVKELVFDVCDQYTLQGDEFSLAIMNNLPVPTPLTDAISNMRVIDALRSGQQDLNL